MDLKKRVLSALISAAVTAICVQPMTSAAVIEIKHDNTISEVLDITEKYPHTGFDSRRVTRYGEAPVFTAPYSAGSLSREDIDDAENAMKIVRFLAGVPYENTVFVSDLNDIAQHGAVLLAASNQFDHTPTQPEDMPDSFFEIAYRGCSEANISAGRSNISNAVLNFMYDNGINNIERVGHRRWIIKAENQDFGIGFARNAGASYSGYRINMHVFGKKKIYGNQFDSYVAWPAAGAFPIQYFAADSDIFDPIASAWSINLGIPYDVPDKDSLIIKLTRASDGKEWVFDKDTPNLGETGLSDDMLHLSVDDGNYGMSKAIVF